MFGGISMEQIINADELAYKTIEKELQISKKQISQTIQLLQDGNTVPFIARYRKEMTGSLDEVQIKAIQDRWNYLQNLQQRKTEVLKSIEEQGKLTEELKMAIEKAQKLQEVEDLYRPYKQKRRTKATIAKEKGLEPLADIILTFNASSIEKEAEAFINEDLPVATIEDAINGALDIITERISDDADIRKWVRHFTFTKGTIQTTVKDKSKDERNVYEMYYEYEEPINKLAPHRVLAFNRGEKEDVLKVNVVVQTELIYQYITKKWVLKENVSSTSYVKQACEEAYKKYIAPAIERDIRNELTERGEEQAIVIFAENLKKLLLQPPMKGKMVLAVDPAYRTGCKLAVLDDTGKVMHIGVIYPHAPVNKLEQAKVTVKGLIDKFAVKMIAIGNGTASRETEQFIADIVKEYNDVFYLIVNEAGASVYSASDVARAEFPDLQVEERSAVSIGRRLIDPLAELVKIDPKSVGVGQYQHDVSQKRLNEQLTFVVETAVNQVGVNLNTASASLLQYVAGLSKSVAENIVKRREEEGKFEDRKQLKKVPRLGAKTYEQAIGFLRVIDGKELLDATSIHPENYSATKQLLKSLGCTSKDLGTQKLQEKLKGIDIKALANELNIGEITLEDIIKDLIKPLRDPRDEIQAPLLKKDVLQLEDLKEGMELQGTIRNVVDFGAFVDIGVKQDGLVHLSKLSKKFVKHPLDVVSVGDIVTVWVTGVDKNKGRVSLSMLSPNE